MLHTDSDITHERHSGALKKAINSKLNFSDKEPVVVFGEVKPAIIGGPEITTPFAKGMDYIRQYINESNRAIKVVLRNNIAFEVKNAGPSKMGVTNNFIVRDIYRIPAYMFNELHDSMSAKRSEALGNHEYSDSREFCQALIDIRQRDSDGGVANTATRSITIDTVVPIREISDNVHMYIGNLDIVLSTSTYAESVNHPFHLREQVINKLLNLRNNNDGFTINIEFIDNSDEYNTKFIYFINMLFTVKPVKNPTKESGIYITAMDYSSGKGEILDTSFIWPKSPMSVQDAYEKLGLADTQEEAYALGNTKKIMESKVLEQKQKLADTELNGALVAIEHKTLATSLEAEDLKHKFELKEQERRMDLAFRERELVLKEKEREMAFQYSKASEALDISKSERARLFAELDERNSFIRKTEEARLDRLKSERDDYYDTKHQRRKDESEVMKHIPTLIIGGWGLFQLYDKLKTK